MRRHSRLPRRRRRCRWPRGSTRSTETLRIAASLFLLALAVPNGQQEREPRPCGEISRWRCTRRIIIAADRRSISASGRRPSPDRRQDLSDRRRSVLAGDFRVELSPLQSTRALRLHRPLRGRHAVHRLYAKHACARTGAQQRPWREVHRGPASDAARVPGSVPVCREGAGTRVRGETTYSGAEGRVGRQPETTPPLNQHVQNRL